MPSVINSLKDYTSDECFGISIGVFDGVHLGHKKILKLNYNESKLMNCKFGVLTFKKRHNSEVYAITTLEHRIRLLKEIGCDEIFVIDEKDKWFFDLSAEMFISDVLKKKLKCRSIYVGSDFKFGKGRLAGIEEYRAVFEKNGIKANVLEFEKIGGEKISSSHIRNLLKDLNFEEVKRYLGREYSFGGIVVKGEGIGGKIGVKTANINLDGCRLPFEGVFSCKVVIENRKDIFKGVLSIGENPTVSNTKEQKAEVHIINLNKNLYGSFIEVFPEKKIRDTVKFDSLKDLKRKIEEDIKTTIKV